MPFTSSNGFAVSGFGTAAIRPPGSCLPSTAYRHFGVSFFSDAYVLADESTSGWITL